MINLGFLRILTKRDIIIQQQVDEDFYKDLAQLSTEKEQLQKKIEPLKKVLSTYENVIKLVLKNKEQGYSLYQISNKKNKSDEHNELLKTLIVIVDNRQSPSKLRNHVLTTNSGTMYNGGSFELYAINYEMLNDLKGLIYLSKQLNLPCLDAELDYTETETTVRINHFNCRFENIDYRGNGYGYLLLHSFTDLLSSNTYNMKGLPTRIIGILSSDDIKCKKDIDIRNGFYENRGFKFSNLSDDKKSGEIYAPLEDLLLKFRQNQHLKS